MGSRESIGVRWCSLLSLILALGAPACTSYSDDSAGSANSGGASAVGAAGGPGATEAEASSPLGPDGEEIDGILLTDEDPAGEIFIVEDVEDPGIPLSCEVDAEASTEGLDAYSVSNDDVGRRVVYSWTTVAQIDELRADPTLLTRVANENDERGRAADFILSFAEVDDFSAILARPEYEAKRFGWTNSWATLLGWAGETYGDQLLEIRFKPEAFIGRLVTSTQEWSFFDVDNHPVDAELVKAEPERIAAFLFVDDRDVVGCGGSFGNGVALREYVVCNESMIEGWSAFTPAILDELERAVDVLGDFRGALAAAECDTFADSVECWRGRVVELWRTGAANPMESYEVALAIPNELYAPSTGNVDRLIERLNTVMFDPDPLEYPVDAAAAGVGDADAGIPSDEPTMDAPDAG